MLTGGHVLQLPDMKVALGFCDKTTWFSNGRAQSPDGLLHDKWVALATMWRPWQEFIDFESLKQRHLKMPFEERLDVLFAAIGMLYGEYLTARINEFHKLEEELVERFKREQNPDQASSES